MLRIDFRRPVGHALAIGFRRVIGNSITRVSEIIDDGLDPQFVLVIGRRGVRVVRPSALEPIISARVSVLLETSSFWLATIPLGVTSPL